MLAKGVKTAYDFTQLPDDWVQKQMSIVGLRLKHELEGTSVLELEKPEKKKSIATTRSFEKNYKEFEELKERVTTFAISCGEKLRSQKSNCTAIMVFIHTNGHRSDLKQYSKNIVVKLPFATSSSIDLVKYAVIGLKEIFKQGYSYKKAGVVVMDIVPANPNQLTLFEKSNPKHDQLMKVMDEFNGSYGSQKIKLASQDLGRTWKMKQERLSPRYSTQLSDIITVKV